jgi:uncharacterized protein YndB with AHSA1/START domain
MVLPESFMTVTTPSEREIVMTRFFEAPRDLVFETFTQPEHVKQWWGPRGWSLPECEMDLRVGGSFRYLMRGPAGEEHRIWGTYFEIVPPERLVFDDGFEAAGMNDFDARLTLIFEEEKPDRTKITMTSLYKSRAVRDRVLGMGLGQGWGESFDRLDEVLATMSVEAG